MLRRLGPMAISLAAVLAAYWVYALAAVPLIEPRTEIARQADPPPAGELPPDPIERRKALLATLFPSGSWELDHPIVLENDRGGMLLVKKYSKTPEGHLKLEPCTIVFFPDGVPTAAGEPSRSIVMQAPRGATLEFDAPFDESAPRFERLKRAELPGEVLIQSGPGGQPAQELRISTRDVRMDEQTIRTSQAVEFQLAGNRGSGRGMEILLAQPEQVPGKRRRAPAMGRLETFQLQREVKLHVEMKRGFWGQTARRPGDAQRPLPPVEITCQGPFRFELTRNLATFHDQVDVLMLNPQGPSDQLACQRLSLAFARVEAGADGQAKPAGPKLPKLEPVAIEAVGNPVVFTAASQGANIRCQRFHYDLKTKRLSLDGQDDVLLRRAGDEFRAPHLELEIVDEGQVQRLLASGPGSLQGTVPRRPDQKFTVVWANELRLRPHDNCQLLSIRGNASVRSSTWGQLAAGEIHLWLDQSRPDEAALAAPAAAPPPRRAAPEYRPDRMMAEGNVRMDGPQLAGAVGRLEVWFDHAEEGSAQASTPLPRPLGVGQQPVRRYEVGGSLVRLVLVVHDGQAQPSDVTLAGAAHFAQVSSSRGEAPLRVAGESVRVLRAQSPDGSIDVRGEPARVEANGLTLVGARIQLDRAQGRMWIDGAGRMNLLLDRDLEGKPLARPQPVDVAWQGGMAFDGRAAVFDRGVVVRSPDQLLRGEKVELALRERIDFADAETAKALAAKAAVEWVRCPGQFSLEHRTTGQQGTLAIAKGEARDLSFNRETGALTAKGPGWLTTVQRGGPRPSAGLNLPTTPSRAAQPPSPPKPLSYVFVKFQGEIVGSVLRQRQEIAFHDRVRAVYGGVSDWDEKLPEDDPDRLGRDGALLGCNQLTVRQMSIAPNQPPAMELDALGNVSVEGQAFTAKAHRLSYAQAKDQLVLEGRGQSDAELFLQSQPGAQPVRWPARRMMFWPSSQRVQVDDTRMIDVGSVPTGSLPAPTRK